MPDSIAVITGVLGFAAMAVLNTGAAPQAASSPSCKPARGLQRLADLTEASGLAASRATAGRLWTHNDSGAPVLYAVDANGKPAERVTIEGARVEDWEALSIGPCGSGSCLYIADIGDNDAGRKQITVYRLAEPAASATTAKVTAVFHASYPDGPRDAEALLVAPDGALLIVTKGDQGPVAVYRFPRDSKPDATVQLERVGQPLAGSASKPDRITDAAISSNGAWVVLRTLQSLTFYRGDEFLRGNFEEQSRVDLSSLREPQGEAVAFGTDGTLFVAGEGGGKGQPGTLGVLSCRF